METVNLSCEGGKQRLTTSNMITGNRLSQSVYTVANTHTSVSFFSLLFFSPFYLPSLCSLPFPLLSLSFSFHPPTLLSLSPSFLHPFSPYASLLCLFLLSSSPLLSSSVSDLFFTTTVPPTINMNTDVTTVCPIPNIPQATVTAENPLGTNEITYCNVTSERGSFRSRSVAVVDPTQQGLFTPNYANSILKNSLQSFPSVRLSLSLVHTSVQSRNWLRCCCVG